MVGFNIFAPTPAEEQDCNVWLENMEVVAFFSRLGTRWNVGMNGATGLQWAAVYPLMDRLWPEAERWHEVLYDLETMERAAILEMNKKG